MRGISFFVAPIRDHAYFEQPVLERKVRNAFLQRARLAAQILHLVGGGGTGGVTSQPALAGLHKLLRPGIVQALGDAFLAAKLGKAVLAAQTVQHDPDLVFRREMSPRRTTDVFHHLLGRLLGAWGSGSHLRSFVMTTRPKPSLNHNLKSGP